MTATLIWWAALAALFYFILVLMTALVPTTERKTMPGIWAAVLCGAASAVLVLVARGVLGLFF